MVGWIFGRFVGMVGVDGGKKLPAGWICPAGWEGVIFTFMLFLQSKNKLKHFVSCTFFSIFFRR